MEDVCKKLIVLTGPTAVGKTELSIKLAKSVNAEIISADSMQVYRHMNVGTAKITREEMQGVPHHLLDIIEPYEEFNVTIFKKKAYECINDIISRGKIPILAGGTGFYIQAVLKDVEFTGHESDEGFRDDMQKFAKEYGNEALHKKLSDVDIKAAENIHPNNVKRVIRALEYYHLTGQPFSSHNEKESSRVSPFNYVYFVLNDNRKTLYERIDRRVDTMISNGLIEEVKGLVENGMTRDMVSMQGIGYKEVIDYLENHISYEDMIYILKRDTRHFAKRQLTWFGRENDVIWLDKSLSNDDELLEQMINILKEKNILT